MRARSFVAGSRWSHFGSVRAARLQCERRQCAEKAVALLLRRRQGQTTTFRGEVGLRSVRCLHAQSLMMLQTLASICAPEAGARQWFRPRASGLLAEYPFQQLRRLATGT